MLKNKIEVVSFDFWETIFDFLDKGDLVLLRKERIEKLSKLFSIPVDVVSKAYESVLSSMCDRRENTGEEFTVIELIESLLVTLGLPLSLIDAVFDIFTETVKKYISGPTEGVVDLIKRLKNEGYGLCVVSNTINGLLERDLLKKWGIYDYFDFMVFSSEVRVRKPSKEIFRLVTKKMQVPSYKVLHVGDDVFSDVFGALSSGMWTCHYNGRNSLTTFLPHFIVKTWKEFDSFIL